VTQRVIEGDCLEVLPTLPDASVDAVVCDPPYGQTNESYDGPIAFSPDVWRECYRVAKDNAALVAFTGSPTYHRIASAIEAGGWKVRQMWAWVYRDGMMTTAYPKDGYDRLAPAMDPIVFATKGKVLLNTERNGSGWVRDCEQFRGWSERSRTGHGRHEASGSHCRAIVSDGVNPFEYFDLARTGRKPDGVSGHPNQKPLALMRWLVAKLPGGTVLDPFVGSGTTLLACHHEGRLGVGIERNVSYCAIARRRLAEAEAQMPLFTPAEGVSA
jgi:DNA modification methylase